jgi:hypothetical protein
MSIANELVRRVCGRVNPRQMGRWARGGRSRMSTPRPISARQRARIDIGERSLLRTPYHLRFCRGADPACGRNYKMWWAPMAMCHLVPRPLAWVPPQLQSLSPERGGHSQAGMQGSAAKSQVSEFAPAPPTRRVYVGVVGCKGWRCYTRRTVQTAGCFSSPCALAPNLCGGGGGGRCMGHAIGMECALESLRVVTPLFTCGSASPAHARTRTHALPPFPFWPSRRTSKSLLQLP